jgi:uncharacterized membrane protein YphA (DoxX/SURF4 family)
MKTNLSSKLQKWEGWAVSALRMAIGWHFLYEGVAKVVAGNWSSQSYLANTTGFFSSFYHWLAASPVVVDIVDKLNIIGLILIGLALFLGCFSRLAASFGALLLLLYYFAYPPFGFSLFTVSGESHLYIVNYLLIEAAVLVLLAVYPHTGYGIEKWLRSLRASMKTKAGGSDSPEIHDGSRRDAIKNLISLPLLGLMGWGAYENNRRYRIDVMSGATIQLNRRDLSELTGALPQGRIGKHEISRLVMGGNLIGGWSHARDLLYVNQLFKAYNNERKVFETLMLCEAAGINSIKIGFASGELLRKYIASGKAISCQISVKRSPPVPLTK